MEIEEQIIKDEPVDAKPNEESSESMEEDAIPGTWPYFMKVVWREPTKEECIRYTKEQITVSY